MVNEFKVITLCGSTRFKDAFLEAQKRLTLEGNIVVSVGLFGHSGDEEVWKPGIKDMLDRMHLSKIDMADEIYVINVDGYIGESTKREIEYAKAHGKPVKYLVRPRNTFNIGTWILFKNKDLELYSLMRNDYYYIFISGKANNNNNEILWLNEAYKNIFPLWNIEIKDNPACYVLLQNTSGETVIIELISKKVILKETNNAIYKGPFQIYNDERNSKCKIIDTNIGIIDMNQKTFRIFSIMNGFIVGPIPFEEVDFFKYGVFLDKKTIITYNGEQIDMNGFVMEKERNIFYNEAEMKCKLFTGLKNRDIVILSPSVDDIYKFEGTSVNKYFVYDITNQKLSSENLSDLGKSHDDLETWTASDSYYAYEGYSELELGID